MKKSIFVLTIALLGTLLGSSIMVQGQVTPGSTSNGLTLGMPEVSLLSSSSGTISLVLTTATAGEAVQQSKSDSTARVLISSIIATGKTRTLKAQVTTGEIPAGTTLKLMAKTPSTNFGGTPGTLLEATLSTTSDEQIVTGIGSCYSGTAAGDGYVLRYKWGLDSPSSNYGLIRASAGAAITVTLTLADVS